MKPWVLPLVQQQNRKEKADLPMFILYSLFLLLKQGLTKQTRLIKLYKFFFFFYKNPHGSASWFHVYAFMYCNMNLQQRAVLKTIGTGIIANYSSTQFPHILYAFLYVCLFVCIFITDRDLGNYYTGKDIHIFHHHKYIFLCCPFILIISC